MISFDQSNEEDDVKTKNAPVAEGFHQSAEIPSVTFVTVAVPTALADEIKAEAGGWDAALVGSMLKKGLSRVRAEKRFAAQHVAKPKKNGKA